MTIEDLVDACKESVHRTKWVGNQKVECAPYLAMTWETGGASGGDCYDGDAVAWQQTGGPLEFDAADDLLAKVCPNIAFLQYKALMRDLPFQYEDDHHREYYGNYTDTRTQRLYLKDLLAGLVKLGIVEGGDANCSDSGVAGQRQDDACLNL